MIIIQEFEDDPTLKHVGGGATSVSSCREYQVVGDDGVTIRETTSDRGSTSPAVRQRSASSVKKVVSDLFLPVGYPATVREGYLEYQIYDSIQGLCSYLRGVLCSAAVLEAAGVGNAEATAIAAATTWALKDGLAMIGGLLYSYAVSDKLDAHVKEFRLFADVINDVGFLFDMMAPWFAPKHYFLASSAAVLCKTMCGISAGATKGSITQHFAVAGNMADLNAKESTQETMVSLTGMLLGIYAAKSLQAYDDVVANWTIFTVLTVIHVWANWKAVTLLRMRTLNRARADIVLRAIIQQCVDVIRRGDVDCKAQLRLALKTLLPPSQVHESLLCSVRQLFLSDRLRLGVPLTTILQYDRGCFRSLSSSTNNCKYFLTTTSTAHNGRRVFVSLMAGASNCDELKAYVHANILLMCMDHASTCATATAIIDDRSMNQLSKVVLNELFGDRDLLMSDLRRIGWDVDGRFYFGFSRRRSRWTTTSTDGTHSTKKVE